MPRFKDALTALQGAFPDSDADTWSDISAAYDEDMSESTSSANAYVAELEAKLEDVNAQLLVSQADNYKLMKLIPSNDPGEGDDEDEVDADDEPSDDFGDDYFGDDE